MPVYVCEDHMIAFEKQNQAVAHWNFHHRDEKPVEGWNLGSFLEDEVPEGYTLKEAPRISTPRQTSTPTPPPPTPMATPYTPPPQTTEDPQADKLSNMLQSIGVAGDEVNRIVTGFMMFPGIRNDANYLSFWLNTHMRKDVALRAYIPMVVRELFGDGTQQPFIPPPMSDGGTGYSPFPQYYPPQSYSPGQGWYSPTMHERYQPLHSPQESETNKQIQGLAGRVSDLQDMIAQERSDRDAERVAREQADREKEVSAKFDKLQEMILGIATQRHSGNEEGDSKMDKLAGEFRELRTVMANAQYEALKNEVASLRTVIAGAKPDTTGRTTEDLAHDIGPMALEKADNLGKDVLGELKGLREQLGPTVKKDLERATDERLPSSFQEEVVLENEIIELGSPEDEQELEVVLLPDTPLEEASGASVIEEVEEEPQDPALSRMPRRRRRRKGGE